MKGPETPVFLLHSTDATAAVKGEVIRRSGHGRGNRHTWGLPGCGHVTVS